MQRSRYGMLGILLLCVHVLLAGCTQKYEIFHPVCSQENCDQSSLINSAPLEDGYSVSNYGWNADRLKSASRMDTPFFKSWLEYGEDGRPLDVMQKKAILRRIDAISERGEDLLVVVYVHGWHNNADVKEKDENYDSVAFDNLMAAHVGAVRRFHELAGLRRTPTVLGVYVGWRGESTRVPGATVLSIRGRSEAADRLGKTGVQDDLLEISNYVYAANPKNKMLMIGHSLGGKVLTSAFINYFSPEQGYILNPGVMIVTVNAAVSADCFSAAFNRNRPSSKPLWVNITSRDDPATNRLYRWAVLTNYVRSCGHAGAVGNKAIGHYGPFITEKLSFNHLGAAKVDVASGRVLSGDLAGEIFQFSENEVGWVNAKSMNAHVPYWHFSAADSAYQIGVADWYKIVFCRTDSYPEPMALRNVETDMNSIDRRVGGGTASAKHNGYVSTNLIRLWVEAIYSMK